MLSKEFYSSPIVSLATLGLAWELVHIVGQTRHATVFVNRFLVSVRICRFVTYFDSRFIFSCGTLICALQFSYAFAILICVCNLNNWSYCSYVEVCNSHITLQFSYAFAILINGSPNNAITYLGIVWSARSKGGGHYNLHNTRVFFWGGAPAVV